ncbi:MAG: hypothetical protein E6K56_01295 [Ignavibacteria bacterium]|nr:MAG: hypothetical protein E6K56_01295 [Ignavibacteria bacterium]
MLRIVIWLVVGYMIVKIARIFMNWKQYRDPDAGHTGRDQEVIPPFDNVQDADFEDITPKPPPPESEKPPA